MDFWDDPQLGGEAAGKVALYNISSNFRTKKVRRSEGLTSVVQGIMLI